VQWGVEQTHRDLYYGINGIVISINSIILSINSIICTNIIVSSINSIVLKCISIGIIVNTHRQAVHGLQNGGEIRALKVGFRVKCKGFRRKTRK
jgi:hypothetical protein